LTEPNWIPRGLSRQEAAAYVGISPNVFDQLVKDSLMPQPRFIRSKKVWDRFELDIAFGLLPNSESPQSSAWDVV
jgi:predicted DNA-binding transcriptional regulator AlpA